MEYLQFSLFTEQDFDEIIYKAGGIKYQDKYEIKINEKNCDYILDEAVIELKFIDDNPTENKADKKSKQKKLAELFPNKVKTIVLNPSEENKSKYYQILSNPIQNQLKKASKQLQKSKIRVNAKIKIAIIMNNGLTVTSPDEFYKMAVEQTKNNTSGIDILIVCGMYYFSDKFDIRVITEFKDIQIQGDKCDNIIKKLRTAWNSKVKDYVTSQMLDINIKREKEPIQDLFFELDGIRYVKPPIPWGEKSSFYGENERPREDSSEDKECMSINKFFQIPLIKSNNMPTQELKEKFENILSNRIEYNGEIKHNTLIFVEVQEIGMDKANDITFISHTKYDEKSNAIKRKWYIYGERIKFQCALLLATSYCIELDAEAIYFVKNEDFKWK